MTPKVEPTVEKWEEDYLFSYGDMGMCVQKKSDVKAGIPTRFIPIKEFIRTLLSHSVQEAKAETISMIIDRIEMWADDGQIPTTEHITSRLSYLLASLKQEEEV